MACPQNLSMSTTLSLTEQPVTHCNTWAVSCLVPSLYSPDLALYNQGWTETCERPSQANNFAPIQTDILYIFVTETDFVLIKIDVLMPLIDLHSRQQPGWLAS
jgi:hypothetical protein